MLPVVAPLMSEPVVHPARAARLTNGLMDLNMAYLENGRSVGTQTPWVRYIEIFLILVTLQRRCSRAQKSRASRARPGSPDSS